MPQRACLSNYYYCIALLQSFILHIERGRNSEHLSSSLYKSKPFQSPSPPSACLPAPHNPDPRPAHARDRPTAWQRASRPSSHYPSYASPSFSAPATTPHAPTTMPLLTADLSRRLGPRHRLPPRHLVLRPLPQLPDPARRSDLRNRSLAELDMRAMCEPG